MLSTGIKLEMAHMWAHGLPNPCRLGGPQCSAQGQNQNWPTFGHSGTVAHAVLVVSHAKHGDKFRNDPHVGAGHFRTVLYAAQV